MTQLLISVTSVEEARIALENGADFIDLKDPCKGALGALPLGKILEIVNFLSTQDQYDKKPSSATIGDLPMQASLILKQVTALATTKVDIIKIGFFKSYHADYEACLDALKAITQTGVKLIAVLFAEHEYPSGLVKAIKNAGFYGVMLDTANKNGATFLDYFSETDIKQFADGVKIQGLLFGLAGSLTLKHIAIAKKNNPTYLGFRGGVCVENQRTSNLDADKIRALRKML